MLESSHVVPFCNDHHSLIDYHRERSPPSNARPVSLLEDNTCSMTGLERSLEVDGHPCPFDKLPTEIFEDIFSFACTDVYLPSPGPYGTPTLHTLNLVCKTWFDIATDHHSLWATFTIDTSRLRSGFSSWLCTYLHKSSACPLRITVLSGENENVLGVLDAIMCHSERWEGISFGFPLEIQFLRKLDVLQDHLPLLRHLDILGPDDQYPTGTHHSTIFNLRSAPLLTRISLWGMHGSTVNTLELPWTQLTQVELDSFSFRTFRSRLSLSQHLTTLRLNAEPFHPFTWNRDDNEVSPTRLQNLEELQVNDFVKAMNIADLICPSLKILLLVRPNPSHVLTFLNNSSCRLIEIGFTGNIFHDSSNSSEIYSIIQHPSLENLQSMSLRHYYFDNEIMDILVLDARQTLPFLETLSMDVTFVWREHANFESRIDGLRRMVESRAHAERTYGSSLKNYTSNVATNVSMYLKKFTLILTVDTYNWSEYIHKWSDLEDTQLEELRSDLVSRNVDQTIRVHRFNKSTEFYDTFGIQIFNDHI